MDLSEEKIKKNAKKYFDTALAKGFMTNELMSFLGESFITAPASISSDQNNAFKGGLVEHLLFTAKYAVSINDSLPENEKVDKDSLLKVCFLYQIGKAFMFEVNTSNWHLERGIYYSFNKNNPPLKTSQLSLYYALEHGIKFSLEEYTAIANYDIEDNQSKYYNTRLGNILKAANSLAMNKERENKPQ